MALWALRYSPRVTRLDEAVLVELQASLRLFGGAAALRRRIEAEAAELGVAAQAWAPTALGALALARAGGARGAWPARLDAVPLEALSAARPHATTLQHLGCRTLGELRRLPRAALARRFGAELLDALDRAYGERAESWDWIEQPETFDLGLELPARVDTAPALLFGARRLLLQLAGWLSARQAGVTALTLHWAFDALRPRMGAAGGALTLRCAAPQRDVEHLARLLAEHLARVRLAAPAEALRLVADEVQPWAVPSGTLLPDPAQQRAALQQALERVAARLGPERVLRALPLADSRPEAAQRWQAAAQPLPRRLPSAVALPQPTFLLPRPLRLELRAERPQYEGELQLLLGPHRIEGGWWDRGDAATGHVARDYWLARSPGAGLLWVYRTRLARERAAWFLHGMFG